MSVVTEWMRPKWLPRGLKCRVVTLVGVGTQFTARGITKPANETSHASGLVNQWNDGHRRRGGEVG